MYTIIDNLAKTNQITEKDLLTLLNNIDDKTESYLYNKANEIRISTYQKKVYMRGLIEFTNYCKNTCKYCGLRCENKNVDRYRLSIDQIIDCCTQGYNLGYRTFVLQGGEDRYFNDDKICEIVSKIKTIYHDCAVTLSIGEKSYESYKKYYDAGADRYLLRHETYNKELYNKLHPHMSYENRIECLYNLKKIGYQVGAGFIVGLPHQTNEILVEDLMFLKKLHPHMIGIGPFIPQKDTPLSQYTKGTVEKTCILLSLIRLLLPDALLPATTALGTINPLGREKGLKAGANVVMPNLSPVAVRDKYAIYDGKICTGDEAAQCRTCIEKRIQQSGYHVDMGIGDHIYLKSRM